MPFLVRFMPSGIPIARSVHERSIRKDAWPNLRLSPKQPGR